MRSVRSRRVHSIAWYVLILTAAAGTGLAFLALPGCQNGSGLGGLFVNDAKSAAMRALSSQAKDAARAYISNLNGLTSSLREIDSMQKAVSMARQLEGYAEPLRSAYTTISSLSPDERKLLWQAFGDEIAPANSAFLGQRDRLTQNSFVGDVTRQITDRISLVKGG